ncbi:MAG: LamG domain-containing protein [Bacteroidia bacterium]|nr:LamG domain-containing protein [Bacteroidia bacterium]
MNIRLLSFLIFILLSTPCLADFSSDGVDDNIQFDVADKTAFWQGAETNTTACMWLKRNGASDNYGRVFTKTYDNADASPYTTWGIEMNGNSDTQIIASCAVNPGILSFATAAYEAFPNTTDWHYVCVRTRLVTTIQLDLVVDGIQRQTTSTTGTTVTYDTRVGFGELSIGCEAAENDNCSSFTFHSLTFWGTALTDAEILNIYNAKKSRYVLQVHPSFRRFHAPLDEHTAEKIISGLTYKSDNQAYTGTITGGTSALSKARELVNY